MTGKHHFCAERDWKVRGMGLCDFPLNVESHNYPINIEPKGSYWIHVSHFIMCSLFPLP